MSAQDKRAWAYALIIVAGVHALVFAYCTYWMTWNGLPHTDEASRVARAWILSVFVTWVAWMLSSHLFGQADKIDKKNGRTNA